MVVLSLIKEASGALWNNRLRSSLTVLGMIMGVTSVIAIVAVVEGMQADLEHFFETMGSNSFTVTRFGFDLSWAEYMERMKRKKLTRGLIPIIEEGCPDCEEVGAEAYGEDAVKYGKRWVRHADILGETPNVLGMRDYDVFIGRNISWEDERRRKKVACIGYGIYERLFIGEDPIGKRIKVGKNDFLVIGVTEKLDNSMASGWDNNIIIPLSTMQKIYQQPGNPVNLIIKSLSLETRERAVEEVRAILRSIRHIPYGDGDDFTILTPDAILGFINDLTRAYRIIMIAMPLLSIIIGGIVIMNIMMISVTERTREIGIRKSLGAKKRHILLQFLYESLILSFLGGAIGILFGIEAGRWMLNSLMDIYITPTGTAIIMGFGIAVTVGLFFGIYPAKKAAGYDPIKALNYE